MDIECTCCLLVNGTAIGQNVKFVGLLGNERGNLTYKANASSDRPETSTLSLDFKNTDGPPDTSFFFEATNITSVVGDQLGNGPNCNVTVAGFGTVNGQGNYPFTAEFRGSLQSHKAKVRSIWEWAKYFVGGMIKNRDQEEQAFVSIVFSFDIEGIFSQTETVSLDQDDIQAIGCSQED